jgi:hypothetical protein
LTLDPTGRAYGPERLITGLLLWVTSVTTLVTDWSSKFWWLARDQPATFKSVITRSRGQHCKPIHPSCCNSLRESGTDFRHTAALCPLASPNRLRAPWPPRKLLSFHPLRCKTSMANPMMSHSVQELTILSYWPRPAWGGNRWLPSRTGGAAALEVRGPFACG